jgi:CSLREA domain-containing protein
MTLILRGNILVKAILTISLLLLLMGLPSSSVHWLDLLLPTVKAATTFTVNSTADLADSNPGDGLCNDGGGNCTLRAAIQEANAASGADTINFSLPANSIITLNTQLPAFIGNISIVGPGSSLLTIQRSFATGTPVFPVFNFAPINGNFNDVVSGLTVLNGSATGDAGSNMFGGGIVNFMSSTLTLTDVVISGSTSTNGGGFFNGGTATLTNCKVTGNNSPNGGGILNGASGSLTIINSTVSNNIASNSSGGGILNAGGTVTITGSTVSGNTCDVQGGGIFNKDGFNGAGSVTLTNSTVSGNNATGTLSNGVGGIANNAGVNILTLINTTVTANTASGSGSGVAGIFNGSGSTANLKNSIVAQNTSALMLQDLNGTFNSQGYNLIGKSDGTNGVTNGANGDQVGTIATPIDPKLGVLTDNAGATKTHALLVGSPAIDAGNSALTTDQRGQPRPVDDPTVANAAGGNGSDIGAYEAHNLEVNSTADTDDGLCRALGTGNGCTLREAISAANSEAGAELITFAAALTSGGPATITLLNSVPNLSDMTISGPGGNLLTVQRSAAGGTPSFRVFTINFGSTVSISALTVMNGRTADGVAGNFGSHGEDGGGILNGGDLTLTDVSITGNRTGDGGLGTNFGGNGGKGGGIANSGTLKMTNCTITGNSGGRGGDAGTGPGSGGFGGGISSSNSLTMTSCLVNGNGGGRGGDGSNFGGNGGTGGGIHIETGSATLTSLTISNNTAGNNGNTGNGGFGGHGGGLAIMHPNAVVTMTNSAVTGNSSGTSVAGTQGFGGGIMNQGDLLLTGSTVSGNISAGPGGGIIVQGTGMMRLNNSTVSGNNGAIGGGIFNDSSTVLSLTNATITGNSGGGGNGISTAAPATVGNSIIAGNGGVGAPDINGPFNSLGHNLVGNADGGSGFSATGDQVGTTASPINPSLGVLANNGGPTATHALLAGSPALDAGNNALVANPPFNGPPFTDQRGTGFARIVDGPDADTTDTIDIGAFEAQVSVADIADQSINEDSALVLFFHVGGAAFTGVTATSSNTTLVPNNPANIEITGSGSTLRLVVTPTANASGTSTITVTVNGNNSQTMTDTFVLTVNPVNDAPSFTKGPDQTVNENAGAQTVNNWATNIAAGPADESGQSLTFMVTNNNNAALFAVAPSISPTGTLTYTPATGMSGTAAITITLQDSGGTANNGANTSATQSFNINVREGGTLEFSSATYSVAENSGNAAIIITRSGGSAGTATVQIATSNGTATAADYTAVSQTVTFNDGDVSKTVNVTITDDLFNEPSETVNLTLSNAGGTGQLGGQATALLTIADNDPIGGYLHFDGFHNTTENSGVTPIGVERLGTTTQAVTVEYATSEDNSTLPCSTTNGIASPRCDFTTAQGTLHFEPGETFKVILVLISQDNYVEGPETLTLTLSNVAGGAALTTPATTTLTIADDATEPATNPIDNADAFVRQHYHDFLNREPDAAGLAFWSNQITECQQPGATCSAEVRRINVSAAFFLSIEFQETGYLAYRFYKSAYGNISGAQVPVRLSEFLPDTQELGKDVVIGQPGAEQQLEANKVAYAKEFVTRSRFTTAYATTLTPAQFVDMLFTNAGVTPSPADRDAAINEFGGAGNTADTDARGRALRRVAENSTLRQQETNKAFVLMQYFGYLRRNPNDPPEANLDFGGYNFWLGKLNEFNGNFVNAEMVKAFIVSGEYRHRLGQ